MERKRKNIKAANRKVQERRQELIAFYESQGGNYTLKKVHFYWITREQDSFQWLVELLSDLQKQNASDFL